MITKLKALSVVCLAAAVFALTTSASQAGSFDVGVASTVITGHSEVGQNAVLTLTSTAGGKSNAICETASFEGVAQPFTVAEETVTATYGKSEAAPTGCTLFGQAAQVRMNGCKYTITGEGQVENTGLTDIVGCTAGQQIQIKSALCALDIPEQNGLSHLAAKNLAGGNEVTLEATVTGVKVKQTGVTCPDGSNHESSTATLTDSTIVKAFGSKEIKQVTKHGHQYLERICGEQVTLTST